MAAAGASERQRWMVGAMDIGPGDVVIELGCGHGVAAALLCDRVGADGRYIGVDRSEGMVARARTRVAEAIAGGRAEVIRSAAEAVRLPADLRAGHVVALQFPPFERGDPRPALEALNPWLAPGAVVHIGVQPPGDAALDAVIADIAARSAAAGWTASVGARGRPGGRPAAVIAARRS